MRRLLALIAFSFTVALCGAAASSAGSLAAAASAHAKAHALLSGCLVAINRVPITAVQANTPLVPQRSRLAQHANNRCDIAPRISDLAYRQARDRALARAYRAASDLQLGIGDYVQYLVDVAFGHQNRLELRRAISEVRAGKPLARRALRELK